MEKLGIKLCRKIKMQQYWGLYFLLCIEICFVLFLVINGDQIYLQWNDNLDSNMALNKMFRDNRFWCDRQTPVPMLGGIDRSILTSGYNFTSIVYYVFDTQIAFWILYVLSVALSGTGCFFLGKSIGKIVSGNVNPNVFCICGIIYIFLGVWPQAIIGFALIPWWAFVVSEVYRTRKIAWTPLFLLLVYNISTVLIGIFLFFYTVVFCVGVMIKEKKLDKVLLITLGSIVLSIGVVENRILFFASKGSAGMIKGLAQTGDIYTDSIVYCLWKLKNALVFEGSFYHSGLCVLRYVALPLLFIFFVLFNFEYKNININKRFVITYDCLMMALFINACAYAFDECYWVRRLIPFASGFSFQRFMWISPFIVMMCIVMILHYMMEKKLVFSAGIIMAIIPLSVILDPRYDTINSMYNILHINYIAMRYGIVGETMWQWNDFYAVDLFREIKEEIDYSGEWSVAYGLDPAVLQYNGIKTLDGYYSNYSSIYKEKWENLIAPTLEENGQIAEYWEKSNGIRAYIYSPNWDNPGSHAIRGVKSDKMRIDSDVLWSLNCKYIFSIVEITNAEELGLEYVDIWRDLQENYDVRVYQLNR